mmetsp:Transcript_43990/g.86276  ORF Transcript_43990/g.86276 Transcript_43990/m.86276 type:complete len:282 (-) Transcript_43990:760-1605(-)
MASSAFSMAMTMLHPFTKNCASPLFWHWNVSVRLWFAGSGSPRATFPAEERTMVTATAFRYLDCCFFESGTPRLPMGVSARPTICQNIAPPWPCLSMWDTPLPLVNFFSQSRAWGQWLRSPAPLSSALVRRKVTSLLATSQRGCHFFSVLSFSTSMPRCFSRVVNFSRYCRWISLGFGRCLMLLGLTFSFATRSCPLAAGPPLPPSTGGGGSGRRRMGRSGMDSAEEACRSSFSWARACRSRWCARFCRASSCSNRVASAEGAVSPETTDPAEMPTVETPL